TPGPPPPGPHPPPSPVPAHPAGLRRPSLAHIHAVIRRACNVAVRWQLIVVNPAPLVDAPQARQHEVTPLPADEARRLIQAAKDDRMEARWLVGLALGLRQGEALGLWWATWTGNPSCFRC